MIEASIPGVPRPPPQNSGTGRGGGEQIGHGEFWGLSLLSPEVRGRGGDRISLWVGDEDGAGMD